MTDLQPCSPCREGNHDTCEATGNPFCGCRKADHNGALGGPVVAPIGEVLAAGQRAPQPEMAQLPAAPEAPPAAPAATAADLLGAPAAPSLVDQVMGQLGTVLGLPPAIMGERTIEVGELEPDDIETDDLAPETVPDRGQAGLPDQPGPVTSAPTVPAASEGAPPAPSEAPTYDSIPMVAERDPALYASVWDSHQAHFAEDADHAPNELPEHTYAGTPEEPYACACGANPGSLNKLGSHLGITADVDAMAELGKATVPNQLAASTTVDPGVNESPEGQPDGIDTAGLALDGSRAYVPTIEGLPEAANLAAADLSPQTQEVEAVLPGHIEHLVGELPTTNEAMAAALSEAIEGDAEVVIMGDLEAMVAAAMDETFGEVPAEDVDLRSMALVADTVRSALEADEFGTSNMLAATTPWRLVLVNGDTGMVWEALYDDDQLPTAVADTLLEHFGFAPSPIDAEHPSVPRATPPPPPSSSPIMVGAGVLGGVDTQRPTRIQVARITTECSSCHQSVEPGEVIGYFPGTGWRHLSHA